jgi:predicted PurR-regulated permease PerM
VTTLFFLLIAILILISFAAPHAASQTSNDATTLSYQAFSQLANVYRSGGQAPNLVAKLNIALGVIQDAQLKRTQGDLPEAKKLEDQAKSIIQSTQNSIPNAQEKAIRDSNTKTLTIVASIPLVVVLSTFIFYAGLRTWRYYTKMKLYEMRIVEKKTEA